MEGSYTQPPQMAASDRPILEVSERSERGSRATRRLRREGIVPGVVYGGGSEAVSFSVGARALRDVLHEGSAVMDLKIGANSAKPVIVKDRHIHPVKENILHIDLLEVKLDEKIQSTVAVELEGGEDSPGVKEGGVLEHVTRELNIEALPTDIPEQIVVNVSGLDVAATLSLSEVRAPAGVEFLDDLEETVIATISVPSEIEEPEVEEEAVLIGEDGEPIEPEEGEEGEAPEGEAPAEGEGEGGGDAGDGGDSGSDSGDDS